MERKRRQNKGEADIFGIERGRCTRGGCDCNGYIQKHGRTTVLLAHRGMVSNDNDTRFFVCVRCGHDIIEHVDMRYGTDGQKKRGQKPVAPPPAPESQHYYTPGGQGARGGLKSSYYYASAEKGGATPPTKIDAREVGEARSLAGGAVARGLNDKGSQSYYHGHAHSIDYRVPVVHKPLDSKDSQMAWGADRDVDPLSAIADPLGTVAFSGGSGAAVPSAEDGEGELCAACDPLALACSAPVLPKKGDEAQLNTELPVAGQPSREFRDADPDKDCFDAMDAQEDDDKDFFDD